MPTYRIVPTDQDSTVSSPSTAAKPGEAGSSPDSPTARDCEATDQMNQLPLVRARIGSPSRAISTCQGSTYPSTIQIAAPIPSSTAESSPRPTSWRPTASTLHAATTVKYPKAISGFRASERTRSRCRSHRTP